MQQRHHIALSAEVARAVGGLDPKWASAAAFPDRVRSVQVGPFGCHFMGLNFASLGHFCVPIPGGRTRGYCWGRDASLGIELPDVLLEVRSDPEAWGTIARGSLRAEPLTALLRKRGINKSMDELTFPSAAIGAQWLERICSRATTYEARTLIVYWILHLVQDCAVPHHVLGRLLDGHASFEGWMWEDWSQEAMHGRPLLGMDVSRDRPLSPRRACERSAAEAVSSLSPAGRAPLTTQITRHTRIGVRYSAAVVRYMVGRYLKPLEG